MQGFIFVGAGEFDFWVILFKIQNFVNCSSLLEALLHLASVKKLAQNNLFKHSTDKIYSGSSKKNTSYHNEKIANNLFTFSISLLWTRKKSRNGKKVVEMHK